VTGRAGEPKRTLAWYTCERSPFPSVAAMVLAAIGGTAAWLWVAR